MRPNKYPYTKWPFIEPVEPSDQMLLMWSVGFFDGEGHVAFVTSTSVKLIVDQITREPLEIFGTLYGGTIYEYTNAANHLMYKWVLGRRPYVARAIELMLPYTLVKRPALERALPIVNKTYCTPTLERLPGITL